MKNKVDFDNFTDNYNELLKEGTSFFSSNEEYFSKYKIDIVNSNINRPIDKLLEYGCGIGRNIPFLQKCFPNAIIMGSDISNSSLEIARNNNSGVVFFHENENTDISELFDLIFVAGVFHHVPISERSDVAKTLFNRLAPNGELFIFEHNSYNPLTRRIVSNCPYDEDAVLLKPSELYQYLNQASFNIVGQGYCLFVPPRFSLIKNIEKWLGWLPLGGQYWVHAKRPI